MSNLASMVQSAVSGASSTSVDISLLEDKEFELESLNISGSTLVINKELDVFGDIKCGTLKCDAIITQPGSGLFTELINVYLSSSKIESTRIGQRQPRQIRATQLDIFSAGTYQSASIKTDGDIKLFGSLTDIRYFKSAATFIMDNTYSSTITTNNNLYLISRSGNIILNANDDISFTSKNINFTASNFTLPKTSILDSSDSINLITGSLMTDGGVAINKSLVVGGNILGLSNINITNNLNVYDSLYVSKSINLGTQSLSFSNNYLNFSKLKITANNDSYNITSGSLLVNGGIGIQKNINIGGNCTINNQLFILDDLNINKNINIIGDCTINNNLFINNNINILSNCIIHDDLSVKNNLFVNKNLHINNDAIIHNNLTIYGNTKFLGNTTEILTEKLLVDDPMIIIGTNSNINTDNSFGGFMIKYGNNNSYKYGGLVRNLDTDKSFSLYNNIDSDNNSNPILSNNFINDINKLSNLHLNKLYIHNTENSLYIYGNANFDKNVLIHSNLNINNNLTVLNNLNINNSLIFHDNNTNNNITFNTNTIDNNYIINIPNKSGTLLTTGNNSSITDNMIDQIITYNKVAGSAIELNPINCIENNSGLVIKANLAGTGLSLNNNIINKNQVLSVNNNLSHVTEIGTLNNLDINGITKLLDTTNSSINGDGALQISGGVYIDKDLCISNNLNINNSILFYDTNTNNNITFNTNIIDNNYIITIPNKSGTLITTGDNNSITNNMINRIVSYNKVAGSAIELNPINGIENNLGLVIKENFAGTGLLLNKDSINKNQILSIKNNLSHVTEIGTLNKLNINGITKILDTTESSKGGSGALQINGGLYIEKDTWINSNLNITGNIITSGNTIQLNTEQLIIDDPLIILGFNNPLTSDNNYSGFLSKYGDNNLYKYTGLVRSLDLNRSYSLLNNISSDVYLEPIITNNIFTSINNLSELNLQKLNIYTTLNNNAIDIINNNNNYITSLKSNNINNNIIITLPENTGTLISNNDIGTVSNSMLSQITTNNKVAGSAIQLNPITCLENNSGLVIKSNLAGTGLSLNNDLINKTQILSINNDLSHVTSVGTLDNLNINGITNILDTTNSSTNGNGSLQINGGAYINKDLWINNNLNINNSILFYDSITHNHISCNTNIIDTNYIITIPNISGTLITNNDIETISDSMINQIISYNKIRGSSIELNPINGIENNSGLVIKANLAGTGLSLNTDLINKNQILSVDTDLSHITEVGTLNKLNINGLTKILDTTDSSINGTGALQISGGVYIDKDLWIGNNINLTGNILVNGNILSTSNSDSNSDSSSNSGSILGNNVNNLLVNNDAIFNNNINVKGNCIIDDKLILGGLVIDLNNSHIISSFVENDEYDFTVKMDDETVIRATCDSFISNVPVLFRNDLIVLGNTNIGGLSSSSTGIQLQENSNFQQNISISGNCIINDNLFINKYSLNINNIYITNTQIIYNLSIKSSLNIINIQNILNNTIYIDLNDGLYNATEIKIIMHKDCNLYLNGYSIIIRNNNLYDIVGNNINEIQFINSGNNIMLLWNVTYWQILYGNFD